MQRQHVLQHQRRRIAVLAVDVPLDIEADDVEAGREQAPAQPPSPQNRSMASGFML